MPWLRQVLPEAHGFLFFSHKMYTFYMFPVNGAIGLKWCDKKVRMFLFPTDQDLADILGRINLNFGNHILGFVLNSPNLNFHANYDKQLSRFPVEIICQTGGTSC